MDANNFPKLDDVVKQHVLAALDLAGGSKAKAAELLGVSVKTVYNHFHRYNMEAQSSQSSEQSVETSVSSNESEVSVATTPETSLPTGSTNIFG